MHGRWVSIVVVFACACGDDAPATDSGIDTPIDANEGVGERVYVKIMGVRDPMSLSMHDDGADSDQTLYITEDVTADPGVRFPRRVRAGGTFSVSVDSDQACAPSTFSETNGPMGTTLELTCDGVVDLRAFTATESIRLTPGFDPRVIDYTTAQTPILLPDGQTVTITPTAMYAAATTAATTVAIDATATITLGHAGFADRTYTFSLQRALLQEMQVRARTPAANAAFGGLSITNNFNIGSTAIALSNDTLIVGSPTQNLGAAYVYTRTANNTWAWTQTLTQGTGSKFGFSVAIDADTAVIGAPSETMVGTGAVYVYQRTGGTWVLANTLTPPALDPGSMFGASVAISGPSIVVGAPGWYTIGTTPVPTQRPGRAFAYATLTSAPQTLTTGAGNQAMGSAVAISGSTIAVGASNGNGLVSMFMGGPPWGAASATLTAGSAGANFGSAIGLDGTLLAIGAPSDNVAPTGTLTGSVFIYKYDGAVWQPKGRRNAITPIASELFGFAVAVAGNVVVVGAPSIGARAGAAYAFRCDSTGACPMMVIAAPVANNDVQDGFGTSIAIEREAFAVGAPFEDDPAVGPTSNTGCAYVFR